MLLEVTVISKIYHVTQLWFANVISINTFLLPTVKRLICGFQELS